MASHLASACLLVVLAVAGCAPGASPGGVAADGAGNVPALPPAEEGFGDPLRAAVLRAGWAFGSPERLAGRPADAARAAADLEALATIAPREPRWIGMIGTAPLLLEAARGDLRAALGVPATAPADAVASSLRAAAVALDAGDRGRAAAALPPDLFPAGGAAVLDRLSALPPLPRVAQATGLLQTEVERLGQEDPST